MIDEEKWFENFNKLKDFCKENGHAKVLMTNCNDKSLVKWVQNQRRTCKLKSRIEMLDSVGFIWHPEKKQKKQKKWFESFNKLKDFCKKNGHTRVTLSNCNDASLVKWVRDQRRICKTKERIEMLYSIEFIWSPRAC